jgi:hypothetical protein
MSSEENSARPEGSSKVAVVVALIGLVGVLITALVSNWDKFQSKHENTVQTAFSPEWYGEYSRSPGGFSKDEVLLFGDSSNSTIRMKMTYPADESNNINVGQCEDVWEGTIHADKAGLVYDVKLVSSASRGPNCDKHKAWNRVSGLITLEGNEATGRALHFGNNGSPWHDIYVSAGVNMPNVP